MHTFLLRAVCLVTVLKAFMRAGSTSYQACCSLGLAPTSIAPAFLPGGAVGVQDGAGHLLSHGQAELMAEIQARLGARGTRAVHAVVSWWEAREQE